MKNQQRRRQARRLSRQRQTSQGMSFAWIWLLIGMFIGILGISLIYQQALPKWPFAHSIQSLLPSVEKASSSHKTIEPKTKEAVVLNNTKGYSENNTHTKHESRFEFYQLLPGMEVPIPDSPSVAHSTLSNNSPAFSPLPLAKKVEISTPVKKANPIPETSAVQKEKLVNKQQKPSKLPIVIRKLAAAQYLLQVDAFKNAHSANALKTRLASNGFTPRIYKVEAEDGIWFRVTLGPFASETAALKQKNRLERQKIHAILILQRQ